MKALAIVTLCGACTQVFDISQTAPLPDAPLPVDTDGDGVSDADDNCAALGNDQNDEDEDGVGDVCDNCPLVRNPSQQSDGDLDQVGDACDPRPDITGDCLVVFDSFSAPDELDAHWQRYALGGVTPVVDAQPGHVRIDPGSTMPFTLVARGEDGSPLAGLFDVQLLASATLTAGSVEAVTRASDYHTGYTCGRRGFTAPPEQRILIGEYGATMSATATAKLSTEPTGSSSLVRLFSPRGAPENETAIACITESGAAAGVLAFGLDPTFEPPPGGGAGVRVVQDVADVSAVAIYRFDPAGCPAAMFR